jgi:CelD/BcsL family acetyltransferase involved in cellulose biosynthesis
MSTSSPIATAASSLTQSGAGGASSAPTRALMSLNEVPASQWQVLAAGAVEPNGYYLRDWTLAAGASARGCGGARALAVTSSANRAPQLIALLPVVTLWRAFAIPLPALVSASTYGPLGTPLLVGDTDAAFAAASALLQQARRTGARALILRDLPLDGAAMAALAAALAANGTQPRILHAHARACLDATGEADVLLRKGLGAKKLKDLRRQRNRLADHGEVVFRIVRTPDRIAAAIETFLQLEASGWKGRRGTALASDAGDTAFIRRAVTALAPHGKCEIATLHAGAAPVAAGIVLRHRDRAFFFKLGVDERFARLSPGVQLTLDITRHLCADPAIVHVDSSAAPNHPMIDPIWRGRLRIGDVLLPLHGNRDPAVAAITAAIAARHALRAAARRPLRLIRKYREQTS